MKKTDPSITFLNQWGYNVVKLPRAGIQPMDVVGNDGTSRLLGPMRLVWKTDAAEPLSSKPMPAAMVNGRKTDALEVGLGLSVLANALAAFGASVPSLDVEYKQARKVQFSYTGVTSTSVVLWDVGTYLAHGTLAADNPVVQNYFLNADARTFLITDVLQSNSITVTASNEHGESVALDVPAIQGLVGAKVKVGTMSGAESTLTFMGGEAVTFGFAVQEMRPNGDGWALFGTPVGGDIAFAVKDVGGNEDEAEQGVLIPTEPGECRVDL